MLQVFTRKRRATTGAAQRLGVECGVQRLSAMLENIADYERYLKSYCQKKRRASVSLIAVKLKGRSTMKRTANHMFIIFTLK